uniref:Peptidase M12A domain-containing protein n=1 Tax=Setaria digitata TaxID=48799 RepID=A0A915PY19_9BILA
MGQFEYAKSETFLGPSFIMPSFQVILFLLLFTPTVQHFIAPGFPWQHQNHHYQNYYFRWLLLTSSLSPLPSLSSPSSSVLSSASSLLSTVPFIGSADFQKDKMNRNRSRLRQRRIRAATARKERLWPDGVIPYDISANFTAVVRMLAEKAMDHKR